MLSPHLAWYIYIWPLGSLHCSKSDSNSSWAGLYFGSLPKFLSEQNLRIACWFLHSIRLRFWPLIWLIFLSFSTPFLRTFLYHSTCVLTVHSHGIPKMTLRLDWGLLGKAAALNWQVWQEPLNGVHVFSVHSGFPCDSAGKASGHNAGDLGSVPGLGRSPGEGKYYWLQYSGLENSMDCVVPGVAKSWTWLSNFHFHSPFSLFLFFSPLTFFFSLKKFFFHLFLLVGG